MDERNLLWRRSQFDHGLLTIDTVIMSKIAIPDKLEVYLEILCGFKFKDNAVRSRVIRNNYGDPGPMVISGQILLTLSILGSRQ